MFFNRYFHCMFTVQPATTSVSVCECSSCLTWTFVLHGIDTGAHVANPDFREVMTSYQHLAKGTENI